MHSVIPGVRTGVLAMLGLSAALVVASAPAIASSQSTSSQSASARSASSQSASSQSASAQAGRRAAHLPALSGTTSVTTAPGLAATLLKVGIAPLPVAPARLGLAVKRGLALTYRFPIRRGNPDLAAGTGDILHAGGIAFLGTRGQLRVARFDIDLAAGKIFATRVNGADARVGLLDLDLTHLSVSTSHGRTTLSGIAVRLDAAAAAALNATFGTALPTDGSLVFGSAVVAING